VELGQEIIGVDDEVLDHLQTEQKSANFKGELTKQYRRASSVIGTPDSVWYQKDQPGAAGAGAGAGDGPTLSTRSSSFSSSAVKTPVVKRSASSPVSASSADGISPLTANTRYAATPDGRMGGGVMHTPLMEDDESDEDR
jgi:hypothetical protein